MEEQTFDPIGEILFTGETKSTLIYESLLSISLNSKAVKAEIYNDHISIDDNEKTKIRF